MYTRKKESLVTWTHYAYDILNLNIESGNRNLMGQILPV